MKKKIEKIDEHTANVVQGRRHRLWDVVCAEHAAVRRVGFFYIFVSVMCTNVADVADRLMSMVRAHLISTISFCHIEINIALDSFTRKFQLLCSLESTVADIAFNGN